MQKSRELSFERGVCDGYYCSTSGSVWDPSPTFDAMSDLQERFAFGVANANAYMQAPTYLGEQRVSSSERARPLFNNFNNFRLQGIEQPVTYCNEAHNRDNYYYHAPLTRLGVGYANSALAVPDNPSSKWTLADGAQRRAWWSMQPRFEGEFQALNFLYELKDFKDIAKHIAKISPSRVVDSVKSLKRKLTYAQKRVKQGSTSKTMIATASAATKTMAEVHLTKVFAVDPTVRDLTNLHGQLMTLIDGVQNEFFERGKDIQSTHYSEVLEESSSLVPGTYSRYWYTAGYRRVVKFTATMAYRYEYEMRTELEALKRYYGLNVNASVVWNALPFSFLLDYIFKVGQAIDFMSIDPNVELRLMQYCESLLCEATSGYHNANDSRASIMINGGSAEKVPTDSPSLHAFISGYKGTWYSRLVTSPNKGMATPRLTLPSSKQVTNLVALVRAMW